MCTDFFRLVFSRPWQNRAASLLPAETLNKNALTLTCLSAVTLTWMPASHAQLGGNLCKFDCDRNTQRTRTRSNAWLVCCSNACFLRRTKRAVIPEIRVQLLAFEPLEWCQTYGPLQTIQHSAKKTIIWHLERKDTQKWQNLKLPRCMWQHHRTMQIKALDRDPCSELGGVIRANKTGRACLDTSPVTSPLATDPFKHLPIHRKLTLALSQNRGPKRLVSCLFPSKSSKRA